MSSPPLDACEASADSAGADASADADSEAACEGDSDAAGSAAQATNTDAHSKIAITMQSSLVFFFISIPS